MSYGHLLLTVYIGFLSSPSSSRTIYPIFTLFSLPFSFLTGTAPAVDWINAVPPLPLLDSILFMGVAKLATTPFSHLFSVYYIRILYPYTKFYIRILCPYTRLYVRILHLYTRFYIRILYLDIPVPRSHGCTTGVSFFFFFFIF